MLRRIILVTASWPLSPFTSRRPGDRELASQIANYVPRAPAVLIDGTPLWFKGITAREEILGQSTGDLPDLENLNLGEVKGVDQLEVKQRADAPLTYCALESLITSFQRSSIRLADLLPLDWVTISAEKFPALDWPAVGDAVPKVLSIPFPAYTTVDPRTLTVTLTPEIPFPPEEMTAVERAAVAMGQEPPTRRTGPPEIVEFVLMTAVDRDGHTLGGRIPEDLWRIFIEAPEDAEHLHQVLGVADSFCQRFDRSDCARRHLGQADPRVFNSLPEEGDQNAYCAGRCLDEQHDMREWERGEQWKEPGGVTFARERLLNVEEARLPDGIEFELIKARHQHSLENELLRLEDYGVDIGGDLRRFPEERLLEVVIHAYDHRQFKRAVEMPVAVDRIWGFGALMWQQLWESKHRGKGSANCRRCGDPIQKTRWNKLYCSREENARCWFAQQAAKQEAHRRRRTG